MSMFNGMTQGLCYLHVCLYNQKTTEDQTLEKPQHQVGPADTLPSWSANRLSIIMKADGFRSPDPRPNINKSLGSTSTEPKHTNRCLIFAFLSASISVFNEMTQHWGKLAKVWKFGWKLRRPHSGLGNPDIVKAIQLKRTRGFGGGGEG
ncbi:hypothetical protein ElyMa_001766500 [Elysia marginata]|uniref:Uncharacterized protein n=1 Tax=Elysia marginata TaxID=1093978 RepID=A0AAV4EBH9_9GAST|nr:hypothetical protein ElyMa_001766500 [Elysia marginata]